MNTLGKYTASTGFDRQKVATYRNLFRYFRNNQDLARHDYHDVFLATKKALRKYIDKPLNETRILEIGNGQHAAISLLYHSAGAQITGIDMDYVRLGLSPFKYFKIRKHNGAERALKTLARNILFDPSYYKTLSSESGQSLRKVDLDLRRMNAADMKFADGEFDFVYSNAVFEHIQDVDGTVSEMARVLKPNGIAHISIDLYPSLSGGHNLAWAFPDKYGSNTVPAWDHLREKLFPAHVYLNKIREEDYYNIFAKHFEILEKDSIYEGKKYLTPELQKELGAKGYARDELLKKTVRLVLKKK